MPYQIIKERLKQGNKEWGSMPKTNTTLKFVRFQVQIKSFSHESFDGCSVLRKVYEDNKLN